MAKVDATLAAVFAEPARANIRWKEIEAMLRRVGANVEEGSGSRIRVTFNGVVAVFHRPHPHPEAKRSLVRAVRRFLANAGVQP